MPWCDDCDVYLAPNAVKTDGSCPTCDAKADTGDLGGGAPPVRAPWHFWVMVVALVLYLGWRLVQGVAWFGGLF